MNPYLLRTRAEVTRAIKSVGTQDPDELQNIIKKGEQAKMISEYLYAENVNKLNKKNHVRN